MGQNKSDEAIANGLDIQDYYELLVLDKDDPIRRLVVNALKRVKNKQKVKSSDVQIKTRPINVPIGKGAHQTIWIVDDEAHGA